jgi:tyrosine-specific transport protein
MRKNFLFALSVLIGTIVGAGVFGIPYVIAKSGVIPGFFYFFILGGAVLLIHLFFGEIVLRTKGKKRLIGYSQKYLGKWGKFLITIAVILGVTGALLAYLILAGDFLEILFSPYTNLTSFYFSLIFGVVLSCFIFRGIKLIAPTELFTNLLFFLVIVIIFSLCLPKINFSNLPLFNLPDIFLPYGVILFSLIGWSAIPEITEILKTAEEKKSLKKILILGTIIATVFYILFSLGIIGITGGETSTDALSGLIPFLGGKIIFFGVLAGLITLADSFLILGLYLRNTFIYDLKFSKNLACLTACGIPLILFLIGFRSFIGTIGFVGTVLGMIEGIIIILIFKKAKTMNDRQPEYSLKIPSALLYFLIAIFIFGAISQVFNF